MNFNRHGADPGGASGVSGPPPPPSLKKPKQTKSKNEYPHDVFMCLGTPPKPSANPLLACSPCPSSMECILSSETDILLVVGIQFVSPWYGFIHHTVLTNTYLVSAFPAHSTSFSRFVSNLQRPQCVFSSESEFLLVVGMHFVLPYDTTFRG